MVNHKGLAKDHLGQVLSQPLLLTQTKFYLKTFYK